MTRPSEARIDLDALRHNAALLRERHGGRLLAVLKADAYGHGAAACARALQERCDGFAVAFLDEALALRAAGVRAPLLLLEGVFDAAELDAAAAQGLWIVVHHEAQLRLIESAALPPASLAVWLKMDSGMHRAGFAPEQVRAAHARLRACGAVASLTLMSHFARADEPDCDATPRQLQVFEEATAGLAGERSLCNSAGLLAWPQARRDWARAGIALYGADPIPGGGHGLRPVMTLQSRVFAERWLAPGEALGYGGLFVASAPTRVGLVAIGYADGYPRAAATGTPVAVDGRLTRTLGRVSMDMMTVDLTGLPDAGIGSRVELWGPQVDVNEVARRAGTIAYELLCNVKRVPRRYAEAAPA
ncbi:alanine racemase [Caldimonas tepidiphila]|uniref:alanine racemase n=1 Tax=Caldimonas tepidiphila TaxID=2315841 RepID=UPI000E5AD973|nr:alanine racemase [Caldimonas tepidiphila]